MPSPHRSARPPFARVSVSADRAFPLKTLIPDVWSRPPKAPGVLRIFQHVGHEWPDTDEAALAAGAARLMDIGQRLRREGRLG